MSNEKRRSVSSKPNGAKAEINSSRQSIASPVKGGRSELSRRCRHRPAAKPEAAGSVRPALHGDSKHKADLQRVVDSTTDAACSTILELADRYNDAGRQALTRQQIVHFITAKLFSHLEPYDDDGEGRGDGTTAPPAANPAARPHGKRQKRKQLGGGDDDDDDDQGPPEGNRKGDKGGGGGGGGKKRQKRDDPDADSRLPWACPFIKLDPRKYHRCERFYLSRIADIRQHIFRKHEQTRYCPKCYMIFDSEESRQSHLRGPACLLAHGAEPPPGWRPGLSDGQQTRLQQDDEDRWYNMWTILFGNAPKPDSPYLTPGEVGLRLASDVVFDFFQNGRLRTWVSQCVGPTATPEAQGLLHHMVKELLEVLLSRMNDEAATL